MNHNPSASPRCRLCTGVGRLLHAGLTDQLYGVEGHWDVWRCETCGLAWPEPPPTDIGALYVNYYTHGDAARRNWRHRLRARGVYISLLAGRRALGYPVAAPLSARLSAWLTGLLRPGREMGAMRLAGLEASLRGAVLDVGCGDGSLLMALKDAGWQVTGTEIDPKAAAAARARGLEVHHGTLDSVTLQPGRFQAIVLNHVIEHVPDPVASLKVCGQLLAEEGLIVVLTPNLVGLGHRWFGRFWRGLEIPRHLAIFSHLPRWSGRVAMPV